MEILLGYHTRSRAHVVSVLVSADSSSGSSSDATKLLLRTFALTITSFQCWCLMIAAQHHGDADGDTAANTRSRTNIVAMLMSDDSSSDTMEILLRYHTRTGTEIVLMLTCDGSSSDSSVHDTSILINAKVPKRLKVISMVNLTRTETAHVNIALTIIEIVVRGPMCSDCTNASFT